MFKRDWLPYAAIGGVTVVIVMIAALNSWRFLTDYKFEHEQQRQDAPADENKDTSEKRQSTCIDVAKRTTFPCVTYSPDSKSGDKYTEYDLRAQQEMAEWAFAMAAISFLGVVITTAATIYVALTFHQTQALVGEAQKTTAATERALEISERPWLSVEPVLTTLVPKFVSGFSYLEYSLVMKNAGSSPAVNIEVWPLVCYSDNRALDSLDKLISDFLYDAEEPDCAGSAKPVFPSEEATAKRWIDLHQSGFNSIVKDSGTSPNGFTVVGLVVYGSVFGTKRYTSPYMLDIQALDMNKERVSFEFADDGMPLWSSYKAESRTFRGRIT